MHWNQFCYIFFRLWEIWSQTQVSSFFFYSHCILKEWSLLWIGQFYRQCGKSICHIILSFENFSISRPIPISVQDGTDEPHFTSSLSGPDKWLKEHSMKTRGLEPTVIPGIRPPMWVMTYGQIFYFFWWIKIYHKWRRKNAVKPQSALSKSQKLLSAQKVT